MLGCAAVVAFRRLLSRWQRRVRRFTPEGLVRNNAILFGASLGAGLFGYIYHFAIGRLLGPAAYSVVASAVAAVYLLTLPALIIQLISARFTSVSAAHRDHRALRPLVRLLSLVSFGLGAVVGLAVWLGAAPVARFLQLPDLRVVGVLALAPLFGMLVSTNRGLLQGLLRFGALSINLVLDGGARVVVAVTLVLAGAGPVGAVTGILAGPAIAYLQSIPAVRRLPRGAPGRAVSARDVARYAAPAAAAVIGITYLFNVDVVLARHYLSPAQAGIYAAGAVLARAVYFLGVTTAAVMFPEVATRHARDEAHFRVVDLSLLFLGLIGVVMILVYVLVPALVLLPYGIEFHAVRPFLGPFAAALTLLAVSNLLVNYFLSVNSARFAVPLLAAGALETVLMVWFHRDLAQLLAMLLVTTSLLAASLAALYAIDRFRASAPGTENTTAAEPVAGPSPV